MKRTSWFYIFIKRLFDFVSSLVVSVLILPWLLILLIINIIATKGAPIYFDERVGKNGRRIKIPKYRSMYKDANEHPEKYLNEDQLKQWKEERKVDNDTRITPFGRFLRKSSSDELLQLFCIIVGSMSVVGPRPITQKELDENFSEGEQKLLLSTRPGLVSNWGVNGRNLKTYNTGERQKLELDYFTKRSVLFDLKLMLKAVVAVLTRKGAQ